jgi:hypothetical protein
MATTTMSARVLKHVRSSEQAVHLRTGVGEHWAAVEASSSGKALRAATGDSGDNMGGHETEWE